MDKSSPEVQKHYQQAVHNYEFFCEVHSKLPNAFYDWKITILFYTSIHLLRALMTERDVSVGPSHAALEKAINPGSSYSVKKHCYDSYIYLYNKSYDVRYSGFLNPEKRKKRLKKIFVECQKALKSVDAYMTSQGYTSLMPIQKGLNFP